MEAPSRLETDRCVGRQDELSPGSVTSVECTDYEDEPEVMWASYVSMIVYIIIELHAWVQTHGSNLIS